MVVSSKSGFSFLCAFLLGISLLVGFFWKAKKNDSLIENISSPNLLFNKNDLPTSSSAPLVKKKTLAYGESLKSPGLPKPASSGTKKELINLEAKKKKFDPSTSLKFKVVAGYAVAGGDILLGRPKVVSPRTQQTLFAGEVKIWPNAEVPIAFDNNLPTGLRTKIEKALTDFEAKSSIRFLPYSGYDKDFVVFSFLKELCASYVGRVGGAQPIFLNSDCQTTDIKHEVMHALGFIHEHQRDMRNQYLTVLYENIKKDKLINFDIMPEPFQRMYSNISEGIDVNSILIYQSKAFVTESGLNSIVTNPNGDIISENKDLSAGDLEKINKLYFRKF